MVRPKKHQVKSRVDVRFAEEEIDYLKELATQHEMTLADAVRGCVQVSRMRGVAFDVRQQFVIADAERTASVR